MRTSFETVDAMRDAAYREYVDRQTGRSKPDGGVPPGEPVTEYELYERQPCCEGIKTIYTHAISAKHVAHLYGLDPDEFTQYCSVRRCRETTMRRRGQM